MSALAKSLLNLKKGRAFQPAPTRPLTAIPVVEALPGDLLVACTNAAWMAAGWTEQPRVHGVRVWTRIADGSEPLHEPGIMAFRNVDTTHPLEVRPGDID